ncbi:MAG: putative lipid II flippase MurJ [Planctomycetes bacterium]|nr:putative lipid II flippase MurJ [Planctomycetota bacterium]
MGAAALLVSAATMVSRVLGLVREQVFAILFGASMGPWADAYGAGFRIPNLLRDLFAEGALSAAFVPTFAQRMQREGREAAFALANVVIGAVLVVVSGITVAGILGAPWIVRLLAPGFEEVPGKTDLAVELTRIMMPFLPLVSLAAVAMGQLNAQERFGIPALAAATFNVVAIAAGAAMHVLGWPPEKAVVGWSVATLLGGFAQIAVQVPSLRRTGFRFRPRIDWKDPGLRRIAMLMAPATAGVAATQVNIFVNTSFASEVPGAVTWLGVAFRLMQLPIGVFGVAVATVAATRFATDAAGDGAEPRAATLSPTMSRGLRLVAFLTVPCTLGLAALAVPIVRLLYEYGQFVPADTEGAARCVVMYGIGLYCYAAVKVVAPAFYALGKSRVPLVASVAAVAANVALNFALFPVLSYEGLALGTSVAATANFAVLVSAFRRMAGPVGGRALAAQFAKVAVAGALCAGTAWWIHGVLAGSVGTASGAARVGAVLPAILAGGAVYVALCRVLRVEELDELGAKIAARLGRK